jgi:hypothetical protein
MNYRCILLCLLVAVLTFPVPAPAAIKVLVTVTRYFFGNTNCAETPSGTKVCVDMVVDPWGVDVRGLREGGLRTALTAPAACAAIKTLIINRAAIEYPSVSLTADEIGVHGCLQ